MCMCSILVIYIHTEVVIVVPDEVLEELADLRFAYARLLHKYKHEVQSSPEAQKAFVEALSPLYRRAQIRPFMTERHDSDHAFQSCFDKLVEEEVSLFNIYYMKKLCRIFPTYIW